MLDRCPICREYIIFDYHKCKPCFYVFRDQDDLSQYLGSGEPRKRFATDYEEAAISYCDSDYENPNEFERMLVISQKDWYDCNEEEIDWENDEEFEKLMKTTISKCKKFYMESEIVRNFYAKEIE